MVLNTPHYNLSKIKYLNLSLKSSAGRNFQGKQTFFHKGGGSKLRHKVVDFYRILQAVPGIVRRIDYDPARTAAIALISYANEVLSYVLASHKLQIGQMIISRDMDSLESTYFLSEGCANPISTIPVGSFVHSLELKAGRGGQFMRAFNSAALILRHTPNYSILKLKSGEQRKFEPNCLATIGTPNRVLHKGRQDLVRKAGINRHFGRRPVVRGCAMNPVDHRHGGNTSSKIGSFTPWGKVAKGVRTATTTRSRLSRNAILKYRVRDYDQRISKLSKK